MGPGKRLMVFITHGYSSQSFFSELLGIPESTLSRYIHNCSQPAYNMMNKLFELGLSIDWFLGGKGNMYAHNENGERLLNQSLTKDKQIYNEIVMRLSTWILDNFESIEVFSIFSSIDKVKLESILTKGEFPDLNLFELFSSSGCNFRWAYTGIGSKYNNSPAGKILKLKSIGLIHLINHINNISSKKFDIKNITTKKEILNFLKIAVAIETSYQNVNENILVNINNHN